MKEEVKKTRHTWSELNKTILLKIIHAEENGRFARVLADTSVNKQKNWTYFKKHWAIIHRMFIAEAQWPTLSLLNMKEAYYRFIKKASEKEDVLSEQEPTDSSTTKAINLAWNDHMWDVLLKLVMSHRDGEFFEILQTQPHKQPYYKKQCWVEIHQNFQAELGMQMDYSQMKSKWKRDYVDHKKPPQVPQGEPLSALLSDVIDQELALDSSMQPEGQDHADINSRLKAELEEATMFGDELLRRNHEQEGQLEGIRKDNEELQIQISSLKEEVNKLKKQLEFFHGNHDLNDSAADSATGGQNSLRTYTCFICDISQDSLSQLRSHRKTKHLVGKGMYKCNRCECITNLKALRRHIRIQHKRMKLQCEFCDFTAGRQLSILRHAKREHPDQEHRNTNLKMVKMKKKIRNKELKRAQENEDHSKGDDSDEDDEDISSDDGGDEEEIPDIKLEELEDGDPQLLENKKEKLVFECDKCDYETSRKQDLTRHQETHLGVRYVCGICEYSKAQRAPVACHMKAKHSGEEGIIRRVMPNSEMTENTDMKTESYNRHANLTNANTSRGTKRKFDCDESSLVISNVTSLNSHDDTMPEDPLFQCAECEFVASSGRNLGKHERNVHKGGLRINGKRLEELFAESEEELESGEEEDNGDSGGNEEEEELERDEEENSADEYDGVEDEEEIDQLEESEEILKKQEGIGFQFEEFSCYICDCVFESDEDLKLHSKTRHFVGDGMNRCHYCDYANKSISNLNRHLTVKHKRDHQCTSCEYSTDLLENLADHLLSVHLEENQKEVDPLLVDSIEIKVEPDMTEGVKKKYNYWSEFDKATFMKIIHAEENGKFARALADPKFNKQKNWTYFRKHWAIIHRLFIAEAQWPTLSLVNMKEAYYRFIKKGSEQEKEDVFSVQGSTGYTCFLCEFESDSVTEETEHYRNEHHLGDNRYSCNKCIFVGSLNNLKKHVNAKHNITKSFGEPMDEEDLDCDRCEYSAGSQADLKEHEEAVHQGGYPCDWCSDVFSDAHLLKKHLKTDHKDVRLQCGLCDFRTTWSGYLVRHAKDHEG